MASPNEPTTIPTPVPRQVPLPRPGELLIYDCRPRPGQRPPVTNRAKDATATKDSTPSGPGRDQDHGRGSIVSSTTASLSLGAPSSALFTASSPSTPTPAPQEATFNHDHSHRPTHQLDRHSQAVAGYRPVLSNRAIRLPKHNGENGDDSDSDRGEDENHTSGSTPFSNRDHRAAEQGARDHGMESTRPGLAPSPLATAPLLESFPSVEFTSTPGFNSTTASITTSEQEKRKPNTIRCLQWNIERNYKAKEILATLTEINADILCIQEIDIGCRRSGYDRDHFLEICASQGLYGGFVPEFWELEHPSRKDRDQGGGVHGNAIFSRWPINGFRVLDHVHHAYEWERDGLKLNEPRLGRRFTIVADIETPSGPLLCYCAHLEVFTGIVGRISALSDILADSELYSERYPYQILFGDLNTISHSIARLAKTISTDQYRVGSFGSQEAEWWDRNLWSWHVEDGEFNLALATGGWSWLRWLGVLGLGTGPSTRHQGGFWPSDSKYSSWLRRLVDKGLDKVKEARQNQLHEDILVDVHHRTAHRQSRRVSEFSTIPEQEDADTKEEEESLEDEEEDIESEKSYQEDGSIIFVDRPRSPSIITLESSLMDKSDASWSMPSSASTQQYGHHEESEHEHEDEEQSENFAPRRKDPRVNVKNLGSPSTPSTPSPTLRLIPPTPKQRRSLSRSGKEIYPREDDERGILLQFEDEEEHKEEDPPYQHHHEYHQHMGHDYHDAYENEYSNDRAILAAMISRHEQQEEDERAEEAERLRLEQQRQLELAFQDTMETEVHQQRRNLDGQVDDGDEDQTDSFKDPQPPFLLSTLKEDHAGFVHQKLWSGFTPLVLHQARNPGFYDPWSSREDLTLHNPNFMGILKAKLDYSLLMNLRCVGREMGNHDYSASDHKWLVVEVQFEREFKTKGHVGGVSRALMEAEKEELRQQQQQQEKQGRGQGDSDDDDDDEDDEEEVLAPTKEQRYLWWRERRQEWGQDVQPLVNHHQAGATMHAKELYRGNVVIQEERQRKQQHQQQQQQQEKERMDKSLYSTGTVLWTATLAAAAAVGGFWLWSRGR